MRPLQVGNLVRTPAGHLSRIMSGRTLATGFGKTQGQAWTVERMASPTEPDPAQLVWEFWETDLTPEPE